MSKTDNPSLSERLRRLLADPSAQQDYQYAAWLRLTAPEILQALDDNGRLAKELIQARNERNFAMEFGQAIERPISEHYAGQVKQLESDNARYRATIVQLVNSRLAVIDIPLLLHCLPQNRPTSLGYVAKVTPHTSQARSTSPPRQTDAGYGSAVDTRMDMGTQHHSGERC